MSFFPAAEGGDDDSEQTLEAALSFLADCERSTAWLLTAERDSLGNSLGDNDAAASLGLDNAAVTCFDFFSATTLAGSGSDGLSSPSNCGDTEEQCGPLATLSLASVAGPGEMVDSRPHVSMPVVETTALAVSSQEGSQASCFHPGKPCGKPARRHSNRARDERRQELVYLRKKVAEMETQLGELKKQCTGDCAALTGRKAARPSRSASDARTSSTPAPSAALMAVWGDMAKRQYQERQKAERENVRLKLILERQLKMAKSLEKILRNRHNNQSAQSLGLNAKRIRRLSPSDSHIGGDKRAVLEMLLSGVEQAHREVDAVFEANGLGRMEKPHRNAKVEHDAVNGIVMEIYANKVMPFDMHTTGRAVWRHFAHAKYDVPHRTYYEKQPMYMETDGDTIVESYGLEQMEGHIKANFHVKHILRRYFEDDRIVIVWCTLTDTVEFRSQPTTGIRFLEKGYIVIQRPQSSSLPADCSLLKTCYIIRPDVYGDLPDQAQKIGALTDFALSTVSGTISTSHQMIENFLLAESLKK